jgi:uncharacterized protein (TIGR03435 family)
MLGRITRASLATLISVACISVTFGQTFEVASVKPSDPASQGRGGVPQGGPGTNDPGRITYSRVTLQRLIAQAYGVDFDQIQAPGWISEERYDVRATVPPGATKDDLKVMFQHLLEERFKLALHHITKDYPVYELTIAKGGSKLKENTEKLEQSRPGDPRLPPDRDGFPQFPPGKSGMASAPVNGLNHMTARGVPLSGLLFQVGATLGTFTGQNTYAPGRIVDKTGLTGNYDFNLEFAGGVGIGTALSLPASADASTPSGPSLIEAMEKQLGLKLTKTTGHLDVLVIDHAEKTPTEN